MGVDEQVSCQHEFVKDYLTKTQEYVSLCGKCGKLKEVACLEAKLVEAEAQCAKLRNCANCQHVIFSNEYDDEILCSNSFPEFKLKPCKHWKFAELGAKT